VTSSEVGAVWEVRRTCGIGQLVGGERVMVERGRFLRVRESEDEEVVTDVTESPALCNGGVWIDPEKGGKGVRK
jgi:hypothetical protein